MDSDSIYPIVFAAVLGGWSFLALFSGERTRRLNEVEAFKAAEIAEANVVIKTSSPPAPKLPTVPPGGHE